PLTCSAYTETFYLSASGDATAPETIAGAWDMSDISTDGTHWDTDDEDDGRLGPNDRLIVLDDDGVFRSQLTVQGSGLSGKPITIVGEDGGSPEINGADVVETWSVVGATKVYSAVCNWTARQVFEDDVALTFVTWDSDIDTTDENMEAGTWTLDTTGDLIYVWATDELDPDTHTMEVTTRDACILAGSKTYLSFEDLHLSKSNLRNLTFTMGAWNGFYLNLDGLTLDYAWEEAIYIG
ncbi:unnamed protein product, partial [marine sediment metagenome]